MQHATSKSRSPRARLRESSTDDRETGVFHQDKSNAAAEIESLIKMPRSSQEVPRSILLFSGDANGSFGPQGSISKCLYFFR